MWKILSRRLTTRLDDYYDCTGFTRPEMLAKFMGIPTTTTVTNDTTYVVTLEADVERAGVNFFDETNIDELGNDRVQG